MGVGGGGGCYAALMRPKKVETRPQLQISGSACGGLWLDLVGWARLLNFTC